MDHAREPALFRSEDPATSQVASAWLPLEGLHGGWVGKLVWWKPAGGRRTPPAAWAQAAQVLDVLGSASSLELALDSRLGGGNSSPCQGQLSERIRLASARPKTYAMSWPPDSIADSEAKQL